MPIFKIGHARKSDIKARTDSQRPLRRRIETVGHLLLVSLVCVVGCGGIKSALPGKWQMQSPSPGGLTDIPIKPTPPLVYEFVGDGTWNAESGDKAVRVGTWKLDGSTLELEVNDEVFQRRVETSKLLSDNGIDDGPPLRIERFKAEVTNGTHLTLTNAKGKKTAFERVE